jgi:hypothetical protein
MSRKIIVYNSEAERELLKPFARLYGESPLGSKDRTIIINKAVKALKDDGFIWTNDQVRFFFYAIIRKINDGDL